MKYRSVHQYYIVVCIISRRTDVSNVDISTVASVVSGIQSALQLQSIGSIAMMEIEGLYPATVHVFKTVLHMVQLKTEIHS